MKGITGEYTSEADRIQEIEFFINMVNNLCTEYGIRLVAKKVKDINLVAIQDTFNGDKEYVIIDNEQEDI